jgi:hypothetical protein
MLGLALAICVWALLPFLLGLLLAMAVLAVLRAIYRAKLRCCPWRAGKLTKAIHGLQLREA